MSKLLLLSVCLALVGIPLVSARDGHAARGLKRALVGVACFNVVYLFLVRFVIPRLG